ncbi:MAG: hypothetical protein O4807_01580, partial [Trichodesmium sp. St19_bin2]|nr:hypothetical protein [Trichodesmium sp. St19_bin2]
MHAEKVVSQTFRRVRPRYRPVKKRPVKVRRRVKTKNIQLILLQLKYKNIFILVALLMTVSWIITLPFRGRPASEKPLPTPASSVSPTLIPPYVPP